MKIENLVTYLDIAAMTYKDAYRKAVATRKEQEKELEQNYVKNTRLYGQRHGEIKNAFEQAVTKARAEAAEFCLPHFEELKGYEHDKVSVINETTLAKVNLLKDISITEDEMKILAERYGASGDYWTNRALSELAEENGITPELAGLQTPYSTKLSVINQLEDQFTKMLVDWNPEQKHNNENEVLLSENVLTRAIAIFHGGFEQSNRDAASAAYFKVKTADSQIKQGLLIKNVIRNMNEFTKNEFLFRLSKDKQFSDLTFELSGHASEIAQWKNGKAEEYAKAVKAVDNITKMNDGDYIKQFIQQYENNEFLSAMLERAGKSNPVLKQVLHPEIENIEINEDKKQEEENNE